MWFEYLMSGRIEIDRPLLWAPLPVLHLVEFSRNADAPSSYCQTNRCKLQREYKEGIMNDISLIIYIIGVS